MTPTIEPGRTAYESRFAGERQGPRGTIDAWDDLPDSERAVWRRVEEAVRAADQRSPRVVAYLVDHAGTEWEIVSTPDPQIFAAYSRRGAADA